MLKASPNFDFMNINIPYLHFTGQQKEIYNVKRSNEFLDSIKSLNKYSEFIEAFAHQHFAASIGFIPELVEKGNEDSNIVKAYAELCKCFSIYKVFAYITFCRFLFLYERTGTNTMEYIKNCKK